VYPHINNEIYELNFVADDYSYRLYHDSGLFRSLTPIKIIESNKYYPIRQTKINNNTLIYPNVKPHIIIDFQLSLLTGSNSGRKK